MATDAFLSSLAELRSMPHTHVSEKPVGRAEKPNDFGVLVTLNIPEKKRKQKRFAVTGPKGDRPNLIAATQEAKKWVRHPTCVRVICRGLDRIVSVVRPQSRA